MNIIAKTIIAYLFFTTINGCSKDKKEINFEVINLKNKQKIGTISATENHYGVAFKISLRKTEFSKGLHGFHVHEKNSCDDNGKAAGGHLSDASNKDNHSLPWNKHGHLGDVQNIYIDQEGNSDMHVFSPKLTINDLNNKSLIIHENQDNYTNTPKLGGSGARIGCALIK